MRPKAGHYVVQTVTVDVIDAYLGAAVAEMLRMKSPRCLLASFRRLLPPSIGLQDIHTSVAVDVADAQPMGDQIRSLGNRVDDPRRGRLCGIRFSVGQDSPAPINQLRLPISVDVF